MKAQITSTTQPSKSSSTELYEAYYTMIIDEMRTNSDIINVKIAQELALKLTYDLTLQDQLLTAVQAEVQQAG